MSGPPPTQPAEPKESLYAMSTLPTRTIVPTGTWVVDQPHCKAGFAVNHTGIATVRGEFTEFQGTLQIAGELSSGQAYGTVKAAYVDTNELRRDAYRARPTFSTPRPTPSWHSSPQRSRSSTKRRCESAPTSPSTAC